MDQPSRTRRRLTFLAVAAVAGVVAAPLAANSMTAVISPQSGVAPATGSAGAAPSAGRDDRGDTRTGPRSDQRRASFCRPADDGYGDAGDLFVLTDDGNLRRYSKRGRQENRVTISGLASGERLVGIDTRPANGQLYGVGSTSRLYVIDPGSGMATPIGTAPFSPGLSGKQFGVDFNPTVDRIRIVSDTGQNLRLDPNTGAVAGVDTALNYAAGDRAQGAQPAVAGSGYTNSVAGAAATALYGVDSDRDTLVLQGTKPGVTPAVSPNTGQLTTVGRLGVDVTSLNGFDIVGAASGMAFDEGDFQAYAAVRVQDLRRSALVRINLRSGRLASIIGRLPGNVSGLAASAGPPVTAFATTAAGELVVFDRTAPGTTSAPKKITGLQPNETVLGIDVRPANGQLYALGSTNQLYVVNPLTAAATAVGTPFTPALAARLVGFDVNPQADRIRIVTTAGENLRLNPDTGAVAGVDGALSYQSMDPNAAFRANVSGVAYTNSVAAAQSTTLYDIDAALGVLAIQNPPNNGTLATVGDLRFDTRRLGGFDIAADGVAMAAVQRSSGDRSVLFCVGLDSGRARPVDRIGSGPAITGLAVAPRGAYTALLP